MIVLDDENFDAVVLEAGWAPSRLRMRQELSSVVDVAADAVEGPLVDWTSSYGEMSSNVCFLKGGLILGISFLGSRLHQNRSALVLYWIWEMMVGLAIGFALAIDQDGVQTVFGHRYQMFFSQGKQH